jgi:hypothetical protein
VTGMVLAPWSADQVDSLNGFQRSGAFHPFTCPREHEREDDDRLLALAAGWKCCQEGCGYTQEWAHAFMADWSWQQDARVSRETVRPEHPAACTVTRQQLIDALSAIELRPVLLPGRDKRVVPAEDMADAILAELPPVSSVIGVSPLTGEPLTVSPEAEAAMAEHGLVTVAVDDLRRLLAAVYGFALPGTEDDAFARLADAARVPPRDDPLSLTGFLRAVETANEWLDGDVSPEYRAQPLAHMWARVTKVCSEAGEVMDALSALTGENPRKGVCGTKDELLGELGDTASAAILAIQHLTGDTAETWAVVSAAVAKVARRAERAGVTP